MRAVAPIVGAWLCVLGAQSSARATTFVLPDERELVRQSIAVATGWVSRVEAAADSATGAISTYVTIEPDQVVAGALPAGDIVVRELGGHVADRSEWIHGSAEYRVGEQVLVFLSRHPDGTLRTTGMAMGRYTLGVNDAGVATVTRNLGSGVAVFDPSSGRLASEPIAESYGLHEFVASIHAGASAAGVAATEPLRRLPSPVDESVTREYEARYTLLASPARWFEPDTGTPIRFLIDSTGDAGIGSVASRSASDDALATWTNVSTSNLVLANGGSVTPSPFSGCSGNNRIIFNDPFDEISDPSNCTGVLAIGGYCTSRETRVVNGTTFRRIVVGKVMFNNGWQACRFWNACNVAEVATHELGHVIGLGHSANGSATMAPRAHFDGRCAGVRADDVAGVTFLYGDPPPYDFMVRPRRRIRLRIPAGKAAVTVPVRVKVRAVGRRGDSTGYEVKLTARDGDCPAGTAGTPDFDRKTLGAQDSVVLRRGQSKAAVIPVTVSRDRITTVSQESPQRCTLVFTATQDDVDPTPENNSIGVELNVIDRSDIGRTTAVEDAFIHSASPVTVKLRRGQSTAVKEIRIRVTSADVGDVAARQITVTASDGDCPAGTVGVADFATVAGSQNQVWVGRGQTGDGLVPLTFTAAAITTTNVRSPTRCSAVLTATTTGHDTDASNNSTRLNIDVIDRNDS